MSNVQKTSIDAYCSLHRSIRRQFVYEMIKALGTPTNLEIIYFGNIPINQVTPRTNELVKMGLVKQFGYKLCSISGRRAISWEVTK